MITSTSNKNRYNKFSHLLVRIWSVLFLFTFLSSCFPDNYNLEPETGDNTDDSENTGDTNSQTNNTTNTDTNIAPIDTTDYVIKVALNVDEALSNRSDSTVYFDIGTNVSLADLQSLSFSVKADRAQSYHVLLYNNALKVAHEWTGYSQTSWNSRQIDVTNFNELSSGESFNIIQFNVGYDPEWDSHPANNFYFNDLSLNDPSTNKSIWIHPEQLTLLSREADGQISSIITKDQADNSEIIEVISDYDIAYSGGSGQSYYVSPSGDNANDGSIGSPFQTPQHAADQVEAGGKVILRGGTYTINDYIAIDLTNTGTAANWISIEAYPGETPVLDVRQHGILINGASYIRVKGIHVYGRSDQTDLNSDVIPNTYNSNDWYQPQMVGSGISTSPYDPGSGNVYPHHIIFEENVVSWMPGGGISTKRADYILIRNNVSHNNAFYNVWAQSGLSVWENFNYDNDTSKYRTVISGNRSYSNYNYLKFLASSSASTADSYTDGNGIIMDALRIDQGYIDDGVSGIYSGKVLIENNIVFHNGGKGINIYESDNIDVINNTSYENGQHPEIDGEFGLGRTDGTRLINNIIVGHGSDNAFLYYEVDNLTIGSNIIYNTSSVDGAFTDTYIDADPLFVNPGQFNFRLDSGSPAIDSGQSPHASEDFIGTARPQSSAPDLGAYEYN